MEVRCRFGLSEDWKTPALYSLLYAGKDMTIPPFSGKGMMTRCSKNASSEGEAKWGFCMRLPDGQRKFQVPNAVTDVEAGQSFV